MFMCRWTLSCKVPVSFSRLLSNSFVIFKTESWAVGRWETAVVPVLHFPTVLLETCGISALRGWKYWSSQNGALLRKGQFQNFSLSTFSLFHTFTVPPLCLALKWHVRVMTDLWLQSCWVHICRDFHSHDAVGTLHLQGFSRWTAWRVKCGLGLSTLSMFTIFWSRLRRGGTPGKAGQRQMMSAHKTGFVFFSTEKFNC